MPNNRETTRGDIIQSVILFFTFVAISISTAINSKLAKLSEAQNRKDIEKERVSELEILLNHMIKNKEKLQNDAFIYGGMHSVRYWDIKHEDVIYHPIIFFGDGIISRTKSMIYIHHIILRVKERDDYRPVWELTFRGENKVEKGSIQVHRGPYPDILESKWEMYHGVLNASFNFLMGHEVASSSNTRIYASMSVKELEEKFRSGEEKIRGKIKIDSKFDRRLVKAIRTANLKEVEMAINKVTHINARDERGDSFIHLTLRDFDITSLKQNDPRVPDDQDRREYEKEILDRLKIIKMIINAEGDVNLKNNYGCRPLHDAVSYWADGRFIDLLLNSGADVNAKTGNSGNNYTALHFAARLRYHEAVKILIKFGADCNAICQESGETPLHSVFTSILKIHDNGDESDNVENVIKTIMEIIKGGGNIGMVDKKGKSVRDYMLESNSKKIIDLIGT